MGANRHFQVAYHVFFLLSPPLYHSNKKCKQVIVILVITKALKQEFHDENILQLTMAIAVQLREYMKKLRDYIF